jgi:hypothetical protein
MSGIMLTVYHGSVMALTRVALTNVHEYDTGSVALLGARGEATGRHRELNEAETDSVTTSLAVTMRYAGPSSAIDGVNASATSTSVLTQTDLPVVLCVTVALNLSDESTRHDAMNGGGNVSDRDVSEVPAM